MLRFSQLLNQHKTTWPVRRTSEGVKVSCNLHSMNDVKFKNIKNIIISRTDIIRNPWINAQCRPISINADQCRSIPLNADQCQIKHSPSQLCFLNSSWLYLSRIDPALIYILTNWSESRGFDPALIGNDQHWSAFLINVIIWSALIGIVMQSN